MSHLPECPCNEARYQRMEAPMYGLLCICDRLRACEQRVREEERALIAVEQTTLAELNAEYRKGLDAAREALELLPVSLVDTRFDPDDERRYMQAVRLTTALAAIDALRGSGNPDTPLSAENPDRGMG